MAAAEFEAIDGKSKKLFDGRLAGNDAALALGKISGAIGIEGHVDHGLLEDDVVEAEFGTEKRAYLQASHDAVHVGERDIGGGLAAVDGNAAHVDLEEKRSGMDAADFDAASRDAPEFGDEAAADQRLE